MQLQAKPPTTVASRPTAAKAPCACGIDLANHMSIIVQLFCPPSLRSFRTISPVSRLPLPPCQRVTHVQGRRQASAAGGTTLHHARACRGLHAGETHRHARRISEAHFLHIHWNTLCVIDAVHLVSYWVCIVHRAEQRVPHRDGMPPKLHCLRVYAEAEQRGVTKSCGIWEAA